jgi:hypothetical protein
MLKIDKNIIIKMLFKIEDYLENSCDEKKQYLVFHSTPNSLIKNASYYVFLYNNQLKDNVVLSFLSMKNNLMPTFYFLKTYSIKNKKEVFLDINFQYFFKYGLSVFIPLGETY